MELLAPAGGFEQAKVAIHFGADAIYLAGKRWGMRTSSRNFSDEALAELVAYAHERGVAVHVALNVLLYDEDLPDVAQWMGFLNELGVDAAIVHDLAALELARKHAPNVAVHLSTQASCTNALAADAYARMGVRRLVLAREMTLQQIARLRHGCSQELELEVFAHGSMCMAYSGRCLISAALVGPERSADRGACTQPCRWGWSLVEDTRPGIPFPLEQDAHGSYLLSSNDLCLIEHLEELEEAGVDAIKIEGRAKGSYYTGCVTNAYRQVLDGQPLAPWREELDRVSHRPYSTGFLLGEPTQNPGRVDYTRERTPVAVVRACYAEGESWLCELECRNKVGEGSTIDILRPGMPVAQITLEAAEKFDEKSSSWQASDGLVSAGACYRLRLPFELSPLDILCRHNG